MVKAAEKKQEPINVEAMINDLAQKGNEALKVLSSFDQKKVDRIVHEMAMAALDKHMLLAKMAV